MNSSFAPFAFEGIGVILRRAVGDNLILIGMDHIHGDYPYSIPGDIDRLLVFARRKHLQLSRFGELDRPATPAANE